MQRAEIDEHDPNPGDEEEMKRWGKDVFAALQNLPSPATKPVCDWTVPNSNVCDLNDDDEENDWFIPKVYALSGMAFAAANALYFYTNS